MKRITIKIDRFLKRNGNTLLSILASGGVIATGIFCTLAGKKAAEESKELDDYNQLTTQKERMLWLKHLALPTTIGIGTIACIIGSNVLNRHQQATMASAYALMSETFRKYKNEVKERYGEEVHHDSMRSIRLSPVNKDNYITNPGGWYNSTLDFGDDGETKLFFDVFSGRYFESTIEKVLQAEYAFNRNFILRGDATLAEFYEFLGLEPTPESKILGWMVFDDFYWIDFNNYKVKLEESENGLECNFIEFMFDPVADYDDYENWYLTYSDSQKIQFLS